MAVGLNRLEALIEMLDRDLNLANATLTNPTIATTSTIAGRRLVSSHNNDSAVAITMTEATYAAGSVFALDMNAATNNIAFTLPALTSGLHYSFVVNTTAGSGVTLTITAPSAVLEGVAHCDDGSEDITGTSFVIAATKAILGTQIDVLSDGTLWYIQAHCKCDVSDVSSS